MAIADMRSVPGLLAVTSPVADQLGRVVYAPGVHLRPDVDGGLRIGADDIDELTSEITSAEPVPEGRHQLRYEFEAAGQPEILKVIGAAGRGQLYIDGRLVGQVAMPVTNPIMLGLASGVAVGADPGAPVTDEYRGPFPFTGTLHSVTIARASAPVNAP